MFAPFDGILDGTILGSLLSSEPYAGPGVVDILFLTLLAFLALKLLRAVIASRVVPQAPLKPVLKTAPDGGGPDVSIAGFNQREFLRGAKVLFTRLQYSWDKRDMEDIAEFTSPVVFREVQAQAGADPAPSATEILLVKASLVAAERDGENDVATVFFDALVREAPEAETPAQVRELWHFTRPAGSAGPWRLDGIQHVS